MNTPESTTENINRLIAFRQAVYAHVFTARRDALFDVLDALLSAGSLSSFARLSQNHRFQRQWPSLSAAVEAEQVQALTRQRADCPEALDIVPADGKYGNAGFLQ